MKPRLIERECGGWLAITASGDSPRIGVTAATEGEAEAAFGQAAQAWHALLREAHRPEDDGVETTKS
jgi:hypothetical protein